MLKAIREFLRERSGLAAVEFAMIAPIMLSIYFAITELCDGFTANMKVTGVASAAADLFAQKKIITNADKDDIFAAVTSLMYPYPASTAMTIKVSSLIDNGNGTVKVAWSDAQNTTARTVNSIVSIPNGLVTSGSGGSVIIAEVTYGYASPAGELIVGTLTMNDTFYSRPRQVAQITRTN
jgi:Flp pilus assembly protein TadG